MSPNLAQPSCWIGTSGWYYAHWRERFYPQTLSQSRWLEFYAQHFPTVELNVTFYRLPQASVWQRWRETTPVNFRFAVKANRSITHLKRLREVQQPLAKFLEQVRLLGDKLGPILYQLPPYLQRDEDLLECFLPQLPPDCQNVIEFRHRSWYVESVYELLRHYGVAFCIHDRRGCATPVVTTTGFTYLRLHGSSGDYGDCYSDSELGMWIQRIRDLSQTLQAAYTYFNNDREGFAVVNAQTFSQMWQRAAIL